MQASISLIALRGFWCHAVEITLGHFIDLLTGRSCFGPSCEKVKKGMGHMELLVNVILPLSLAFIMFSLGVGLKAADFTRVLLRPVSFAIGAVHQVLLLPVAMFLLLAAFGISGELAVGFMILAACPGGVTTNILARFARSDVALSVSLTAVISLTSVVTVPLVLAFSYSYFLGKGVADVSIAASAIKIFILTVVPLSLGMLARAMFASAMQRAEPKLTAASGVLFAIIAVLAIVANWALLLEHFGTIAPAAITLIAIMTAIGFGVPRLLGRSITEAKTISVETGIQNSTLGLTVSTTIAGVGGFTALSTPSAVYSVLMYMCVIPLIFVFRKMG